MTCIFLDGLYALDICVVILDLVGYLESRFRLRNPTSALSSERGAGELADALHRGNVLVLSGQADRRASPLALAARAAIFTEQVTCHAAAGATNGALEVRATVLSKSRGG